MSAAELGLAARRHLRRLHAGDRSDRALRSAARSRGTAAAERRSGHAGHMTSRGIRNSNPLNIRKGDPWLGATREQLDPDFVTFEGPAYGFRAAAKLLLNYQEKHGLTSIAAIVGRWAPPNENDTGAYAAAVALECGMKPNDAINLRDAHKMLAILRAMCRHENGSCPYDDATIASGIKLAGIDVAPLLADFSNVVSGVASTAPEVKP